ncbi:MAG TPA: hypothetical protein VFJ81_01205 [Gemmatimonadales bacterium]|nr:hypothetical protein [Gemmatimonadales bacterium]
MIHQVGWRLMLPAVVAAGTARALVGQTAPPAPPGARIVPVVTHDFAFTLPDSLPAGLTTFRLRNEGRQPHHLMLYRLEPGKRLGDVLAALKAGGAHPAWMHAVGGPNAVPHGGESVGTVQLTPGSYVVFCHVKSPDQVLHFAKGMLKPLVVTPASGRAAPLPAADLTVTLRDYSFAFSRAPRRGWQRIAVRNAGTQPHELILSRLAPGKTSRDFIAWMNTQQGSPPVTPSGGTTDLPAGGTMVIDVRLQPGTYSMVCRVRDAEDGRPHDEHGMYTQFAVP